VLGVLQRIAICYFAASLIFLFTGVRGQILWIAGLLAAYWMMMTLIPVPGYGPGRLDVEGNFAHYIDQLALGRHNYQSTKTWDPEGIVSTLPAIATALFGVLAGHILRLRRTLAERTTWLFVAGSLLIAAGLISSAWLPINKKLWTDSFCLFMAGLDFTGFAIFVWLIDGQGWRKPVKPLVIFGMNSIVVYMASEGLAEFLDAASLQKPIYRTVFVPLASPANASLLYSLTFVAVIYVLAYLLYRRGWFLRV
jgi:predicted acyltransferase